MLEPDYIVFFVNALLIGLTAWIYAEPLTEPQEIFNPLYRFLDERLPWYLFKPLIGCFKCVSGQWALWYYLIVNFSFHKLRFDHYNFIEHIFFIATTIFFALCINKLLKKDEKV